MSNTANVHGWSQLSDLGSQFGSMLGPGSKNGSESGPRAQNWAPDPNLGLVLAPGAKLGPWGVGKLLNLCRQRCVPIVALRGPQGPQGVDREFYIGFWPQTNPKFGAGAQF